MRSKNELKPSKDGTADRELRVLEAVHHNSHITQRDLASRVGIALGLTNVLVRNLSAKGYVRVTHAGWKRWLYALTPTGLTRKVQLTVAYLHRFLDQYQHARQTLRDELEQFALNEESRVAIYGTGQFAELVYLGLKELGIEEIEVFDVENGHQGRFLGMPVHHPENLQPEHYDRVVVALLSSSPDQSEVLEQQGIPSEKLVRFFQGSQSPEVV